MSILTTYISRQVSRVDNYNTVYLTHQFFVLFSSLGSIYLLIYIACINPRATRCHSSHCRHQWTSVCQATQIKICSFKSLWNKWKAKEQYLRSVTWQLARWSRRMLFDARLCELADATFICTIIPTRSSICLFNGALSQDRQVVQQHGSQLASVSAPDMRSCQCHEEHLLSCYFCL